ncbi:Hypothetical predicted protein [Mytilus galloprovincialis]|uniref:C1q domain-containing protein n=1 Tax=Mytilus galloprovincialis TaxID=29158 RepID=A0A8B6GGG9_MYTGA|nr:Hypothetical predicted protein [Mytilus galloprovincialis]
MFVIYFILLASVNSFLLDNHLGNVGSLTTNQYLTLSKFLEETKLQHQETTKLRHDMDNSLAVLTNQLHQKFELLDKKLAEIERQNTTIPVDANFEQKYIQLEKKYLNLEQKYDTQEQELARLRNKSLLVDQNIEDLRHLGSIKPLQDLQTLQKKVKYISAQTSSLNMKEQARGQDLIALFNRVQEQGANSTISISNLRTQLKTSQMNHNTSITDLGKQIKTLQTNHNTSITDLHTSLKIFQNNQSTVFHEIESKMHDASLRDNQTFIQLQRQIDTSTEQVSMTAHPSIGSTKYGIIKFDNVKFSIGINNLSTYKSTGKFICEKDGLYLISVSIFSFTNDASYQIYLNGKEISQTKIGYSASSSSRMDDTGTVVLAQQLHPNDSVWVNYPSSFYIFGGTWSTLMIVKIK